MAVLALILTAAGVFVSSAVERTGIALPLLWLGAIAIGVGFTLEVPPQSRSLVGYVAKGACVGAIIGLASFGGGVPPYLLSIGERTFDDLGNDNWQASLALRVLLLGSLALGSIVGLISGAVVGALRGLTPQQNLPLPPTPARTPACPANRSPAAAQPLPPPPVAAPPGPARTLRR